MENLTEIIRTAFQREFGFKADHILPIEQSGSNRQYFRIQHRKGTTIATYNNDINENDAFIYFQQFFSKKRLPVPEVYTYLRDEKIYFQQDLGKTTLYEVVKEWQHGKISSEILQQLYYTVLDDLLQFQFSALDGLDFSKCYPISEFNEKAIRWDLYYFKYMFLRLSYASFHEQKLEEDFDRLVNDLLKAESKYFVYRDFQSRNIMLYDNKCYYIDFQGGRKGSLFYDVASLLYDGKAALTESIRTSLLAYYYHLLLKYVRYEKDDFEQMFYSFVLFRIVQALGAYGYRGIYERKEHFLKSIEPALNNIRYLAQHTHISHSYPYLTQLLLNQKDNSFLQPYISATKHSDKLTIRIQSFSYKNGYPADDSGHGGGFVFDCRALPNPGKVDELKILTGKDQRVMVYMQQFDEVSRFLQQVYALTDAMIERYIQRDFEYCSVSFGCTGGQHRSVYCAEQLARHVSENYDIKIELRHLNQENWQTA